MINYLLVIGCAQSRVSDLALLFDIAKANYGFSSLLVCQHGTLVNDNQCELVIYTDLDSKQCMADVATQLLTLNIALGLTFSDQAARYGSEILSFLKLQEDDYEHSTNCFDKLEFRKRELELKHLAPAYNYTPNFLELTSMDEASAFLYEHQNGIILKPKSEAGSRGVSRILHQLDIAPAFANVEAYRQHGLVAEELLNIQQEFSFDGVGNTSFITAKVVSPGTFPVEVGQLVPAPVSDTIRKKIANIGNWMNQLASPSSLAFHNEIGLLVNKEGDPVRLACIESNQRPAGMKIWNLAEKVFSRNLYELWLEARLGVAVEDVTLVANGSALTIMLGIPEGRTINQALYSKRVESEFQQGCQNLGLEIFEFEWHEHGIIQGCVPRSNSEFAAQACLFSESGIENIEPIFSHIQSVWQTVISGYLTIQEVA